MSNKSNICHRQQIAIICHLYSDDNNQIWIWPNLQYFHLPVHPIALDLVSIHHWTSVLCNKLARYLCQICSIVRARLNISSSWLKRFEPVRIGARIAVREAGGNRERKNVPYSYCSYLVIYCRLMSALQAQSDRFTIRTTWIAAANLVWVFPYTIQQKMDK